MQQAANIPLTYSQVNPYCFNLGTSPHIAAKKEGIALNTQRISTHIQRMAKIPHDRMIVEGVGGLMVPLNETELQLDLIKALNFPVIFVIGLKLGCLNHSLLSFALLKANQIAINGWIINHIDPSMTCDSEYIVTLKHYLSGIPCLGYVPFEGLHVET